MLNDKPRKAPHFKAIRAAEGCLFMLVICNSMIRLLKYAVILFSEDKRNNEHGQYR